MAVGEARSSGSIFNLTGGSTGSARRTFPEAAAKYMWIRIPPRRNRTLYVLGVNSVTVRNAGEWRQRAGTSGRGALHRYVGGVLFRGQLVVYLLAAGGRGSGPVRGVFISRDGGATWEIRARRTAAQLPGRGRPWRN